MGAKPATGKRVRKIGQSEVAHGLREPRLLYHVAVGSNDGFLALLPGVTETMAPAPGGRPSSPAGPRHQAEDLEESRLLTAPNSPSCPGAPDYARCSPTPQLELPSAWLEIGLTPVFQILVHQFTRRTPVGPVSRPVFEHATRVWRVAAQFPAVARLGRPGSGDVAEAGLDRGLRGQDSVRIFMEPVWSAGHTPPTVANWAQRAAASGVSNPTAASASR